MRRALQGLAWAVLAWTLVQALTFHRDLIRFPYPLDINEPAQAILAQAVAQGRSANDLQSLPELATHYGPGQSLLSGTLCRWGFACTLQGQRALAAGLIGLILLGMLLAFYRARLGVLESAAFLLWAYLSLLLNLTPAARPDALGLALWFWALLLPFLFPAAGWALAAAAILLNLAFATKVYFWWGAAALVLSLMSQPRRALSFLGLFLGAGAATLALLHAFAPFALYESILVQLQSDNTAYDRGHMVWQLKAVFIQMAPLSLPLLALSRFAPKDGARPRIWGAATLLGALLFILVFGGARGGKFIYAVHFVLLPALVWLGVALAPWGRHRLVLALLLAFNAAWMARMTLHAQFKPGSGTHAAWSRAQSLVEGARQPYVTSEFALVSQAKGQPVFDSGLSDEIRFLVEPKAWKSAVFPRWRELDQQNRLWQAKARARLLDPATDLVMINPESPLAFPEILRERYKPVGKHLLFYPQTGGGSMVLQFERRP